MTIMAAFWLTEAIPLPVTGMIPVVLFPMLGKFEISLKNQNLISIASVLK